MGIFWEKIVFYLFVFAIPLQVRKILYQWGGGFNEWTSAYLYLTDLLLILLFVLWFFRKRKNRFLKNGLPLNLELAKKPSFWLLFFLVIGLVSLARANNIQLGFYQWFKLLEMIGLFFYLRYNYNYVFGFRRVAQIWLVSAFFQSVIAILQYAYQQSLGLRILTESPFSLSGIGVAKITVEGTKMVRAYGTLPHPNLLAVFLFAGVFCVYFLWLRKSHSIMKNAWLFLVFGLLLFALWLTFSRVVIGTFFIASLLYFVMVFIKRKAQQDKEAAGQVILIFFLVVIVSYLLTLALWPEVSLRFSFTPTEQAVILRDFYNQTAFTLISGYPWLGIGLGNFVWEVRQMLNLLADWVHQPVHNVYLLIASEIGLFGLIVFLMFIWRLLLASISLPGHIQERTILLITISFLFIALFDHFFWSLQQGQLVFWFMLGLLAGFIQKEKAPWLRRKLGFD